MKRPIKPKTAPGRGGGVGKMGLSTVMLDNSIMPKLPIISKFNMQNFGAQ